IAGAACRLPGGIDSLDKLWSVLLHPEDFAAQLGTAAPSSRWKADLNDELPMGWLSEPLLDDDISFSEFFNISPADVKCMSPNARLVLQLAYNAIEDAGIAPRSLVGQKWSVYTSTNDSCWREMKQGDPGPEGVRTLIGAASDLAGARLSYFLDLRGPAIEVKTTCSSSAVAVHQACSAIRAGECDGAIVVAAVTHFSPDAARIRRNTGIGSLTGRSLPFSKDADGFLPSEGAAALVIQKSSDCVTPPYAIIRATALGQDGRSHGFFSPNGVAQAKLLMSALKNAQCTSDDIGYHEAHGTGTPVGDTIELEAIKRVYGSSRSHPLLVGSVKGVIGHTEECSGITSILKVILCFQNNVVTPQPMLESLNPSIASTPNIVIAQRVEPFVKHHGPRLSSLSSFGLSG
ncbi:thiolase-like protein, partial [Gloeophyllum trabeum ATCC 11539]